MKSIRTKFFALNVKSKTVERYSSSMKRKGKYVERNESEAEANFDENSDDDSDSDLSYIEMKKMVAMIVKGFKGMKYKKFTIVGNTSKKVSGDAKTDGYKKKDDKENKYGKFDKTMVKWYNCDGMGHFDAECRKTKSEKAKALISEKKD